MKHPIRVLFYLGRTRIKKGVGSMKKNEMNERTLGALEKTVFACIRDIAEQEIPKLAGEIYRLKEMLRHKENELQEKRLVVKEACEKYNFKLIEVSFEEGGPGYRLEVGPQEACKNER
jgi:hypothetical protein